MDDIKQVEPRPAVEVARELWGQIVRDAIKEGCPRDDAFEDADAIVAAFRERVERGEL